MQNNEHKEDTPQKTDETETQLPNTIFSKEEIRSTVKGCLVALIQGHVTLEYTSAQELLEIAKMDGKKLSVSEARSQEAEGKKSFVSLVDICDGTTQAKPEEIELATYKLFGEIIRLRLGHRINGRFYEMDVEKRLNKLEEDLAVTNNFVEEFIIWIKQGMPER